MLLITVELIASQLESDGHYDMQEFILSLPIVPTITCDGCIYNSEDGCNCPEECKRVCTDYYTKEGE